MNEEADVEAAGGGAAGEVKAASSAALSISAMVAMSVLSILFVAAVAHLLPRGDGDEENFPAAVWRLSPVICGYLFLMTAAVWRKSATPTRLVGVTASLLLADAADSLVAPLRLPARLAMFAATIYSAAVLGHAVAELRHHAACRRPPSDAAAAADATPVYETKAERGHREHGKEGILVAVVLVNVAVAAFLILTSWMVGKEAAAAACRRRRRRPPPLRRLHLRPLALRHRHGRLPWLHHRRQRPLPGAHAHHKEPTSDGV